MFSSLSQRNVCGIGGQADRWRPNHGVSGGGCWRRWPGGSPGNTRTRRQTDSGLPIASLGGAASCGWWQFRDVGRNWPEPLLASGRKPLRRAGGGYAATLYCHGGWAALAFCLRPPSQLSLLAGVLPIGAHQRAGAHVCRPKSIQEGIISWKRSARSESPFSPFWPP